MATAPTVCSRAGCRSEASFAVIWHNPRIHTDGREKTWLACAEHRDFLHQYLASRGFPVRVEAFSKPLAEPSRVAE